MTLEDFQAKGIIKICRLYKDKVVVILPGNRENIRPELIFRCSIAILPIQNNLYDIVKNKHNKSIKTLNITQLKQLIAELQEKQFLVVGEENIKC